jgi:hypothetical protein
VTGKARLAQGGAGKMSRGSDFAMVRYIDAGGDEHYVGLAEAAAVPFENGRMARNIPAYRDIAHTPGRYWAATTGELVEFESHLDEKWPTLLDFDAGVTGFFSQPMELEAADEHGPWHHVLDIFARRADGSGLLLDVKNPARLDDEPVRLQAARTAALCERVGWDYEMVGEPPAQRWANVFDLSGKRRPLHLGQDLVPRLLELAAVPVPVGDLLSFVMPEDLARGVLLHLCWRQAVVFDLDRPLRESTPVRTDPDMAAVVTEELAAGMSGR